MKPIPAVLTVLATSFLGALLLVTGGCEISDGDETIRQVAISVAGTYQNSAGIPVRQSGATITSLSVIQNGDQLTAIDNVGARWTGTIGSASETLATVNLRGRTTTGAEVVITGTITISDTTGTLTGLWAEPGITAEVTATATVAGPLPTATPVVTGTPTATATATAAP